VVMADLIFHHGAQFGQAFDFQLIPVPYILGDVLLATLVELFGSTLAGALWTAFVLVSLPAALLFYLRVNGVSPVGRLLVLLISLYLATDWFFLLGFTQFRLGFAITILALGVADLLRRRWSTSGFIGFCALVVVGYATHLTAVVFLAPALVTSSLVRFWFRTTTVRREILLLAPALVVLGWHYGIVNRAYAEGSVADYPYYWGNVHRKISRLSLSLLRIRSSTATLLLLVLMACVVWGLWRNLRLRTLTKPAVVEMLALAATFLGLYVVLPSQYSDASYVDVRALVPMALFLILACAHLRESGAPQKGVWRPLFIMPFAVALAVCNLAWLVAYTSKHNAWGNSYREIVATVPRGAYVLPIYTSAMNQDVYPLLHMGSFVVTDRGAVIPSLFSGKSGSHLKYFRYKATLYSPPEFWYNDVGRDLVSWPAVACDYQYLLVSKPFDERRIGLPTALVSENDRAALLAIVSQGSNCGREGTEAS